MTVLRLLQVLRRAWYVVIAGFVLTSLAAGWVQSQTGVYYGQADVVFLRPVNRAVPNGLSVSSSSVIATAGIVERTVNARGSGTRVVSEQVTILGMGLREGELIRLPNSGGQWANNFDRAVLDVEVVDTTAPQAQARLQSVVTRVVATLNQMQSDAAVPEDLRIRAQLSPSNPHVSYQAGNMKRALAMTLLLGGGLTWTGLVLFEVRGRRRSHQVTRVTGPTGPGGPRGHNGPDGPEGPDGPTGPAGRTGSAAPDSVPTVSVPTGGEAQLSGARP